MREMPEMFKNDEIAQAINLADAAGDLCCDLALDAGSLLDFTKESDDALKFFDMLGEAIDKLSGVVNEIGQLYCMLPYYEAAGMSVNELEEFRIDRLEGLDGYRDDVVKMLEDYRTMRDGIPMLREPKSKIYLYRPKKDNDE